MRAVLCTVDDRLPQFAFPLRVPFENPEPVYTFRWPAGSASAEECLAFVIFLRKSLRVRAKKGIR